MGTRHAAPLALALSTAAAGAGQAAEPATGKALFETRCGLCHDLALPRSQRLDRATWQWVIDDMVNEFGASFITEEEQTLILEYLVEHHGPDSQPAGN